MAPSAATIEYALQQAVWQLKKAGGEVAVNAVRRQVEDDLDLDTGYFRTDSKWKNKSKDIISAAFEADEEELEGKIESGKKRASTSKEEPARKKIKLDAQKHTPVSKAKTTQSELANKIKSKTPAVKSNVSATSKKSASAKTAKSKSKPAARSTSLSASEDDDLDEDSETSAVVTPEHKKLGKAADAKPSRSRSVVKHKKPTAAKKVGLDSDSEDGTVNGAVAPPPKRKSTGRNKKSRVKSEEDDSEATDVSLIDHGPRSKTKKTAKTMSTGSDNSDDTDVSGLPPKGRQARSEAKKVEKAESDSEDTDVSLIDHVPPQKKQPAKSKAKKQEEESEDTDISLLNKAPARKRKKGDESNGKKSQKRKSTSKAKPAAASGLSPDEETIKTLQKQLLQCGIRKLWHRELTKCDTPQDKIQHLKTMLEDAGMTGRFSLSRAAEIKEARELQAELESATDFQRNWGYGGDTGRGRRARTSVSMRIDDASSDEDAVQQPQGGAKTGLVDFGDSGDSGSEF